MGQGVVGIENLGMEVGGTGIRELEVVERPGEMCADEVRAVELPAGTVVLKY